MSGIYDEALRIVVAAIDNSGLVRVRPEAGITAETRLAEDLGFGSLDIVDTTMEVEEAVGGFLFTDDEVAGFRSVGDIAQATADLLEPTP